jgi:hypothetical protein
MAAEHDDLLLALREMAGFAEQLLGLSDRLATALAGREVHTVAELAQVQADVDRWRRQLRGLRQQLAIIEDVDGRPERVH